MRPVARARGVWIAALAVAIVVGTTAPGSGHEIMHEVARGEAVIVTLHYPEGTPFSYESFEIFRPDEELPFHVGRTDASGRISFLPDRDGTWRIRAFSEDGHGVDITVEAGPAGTQTVAGRSSNERYMRAVAGLAIVFGLFGVVSLFIRRRKA